MPIGTMQRPRSFTCCHGTDRVVVRVEGYGRGNRGDSFCDPESLDLVAQEQYGRESAQQARTRKESLVARSVRQRADGLVTGTARWFFRERLLNWRERRRRRKKRRECCRTGTAVRGRRDGKNLHTRYKSNRYSIKWPFFFSLDARVRILLRRFCCCCCNS